MGDQPGVPGGGASRSLTSGSRGQLPWRGGAELGPPLLFPEGLWEGTIEETQAPGPRPDHELGVRGSLRNLPQP